jgi:hypothetical protein
VARVVKVDVEGLIRGGSAIHELADILSTHHRQSMVRLSDAEPGWVGSSADGLLHMSQVWQKVADDHHTGLALHAGRVVEAAKVFRASEEHRSAAINRADTR